MSRCPSAGVLDRALSRRYRLPTRTRGVRADLRVLDPSGRLHHGAVAFGCSRHPALRLVGADPGTHRWVAHELRGWARDAFARSFAAAEGRYEVHVHQVGHGEQLARLADEATGTCFRLRDGRAVQRIRLLGGTRITTTWDDWLPTEDGRELPAIERVEVLDVDDGEVLRVEERATSWTSLAPHLPVERVVVETDPDGTRRWEIRLLRPAILLPSGPVGG